MDCVDDTKTQMTSKMTCEPKSTVSCSPETTELCIPGKKWNVLDFRRGVASKWNESSNRHKILLNFFFKHVDTWAFTLVFEKSRRSLDSPLKSQLLVGSSLGWLRNSTIAYFFQKSLSSLEFLYEFQITTIKILKKNVSKLQMICPWKLEEITLKSRILQEIWSFFLSIPAWLPKKPISSRITNLTILDSSLNTSWPRP